ncbi:acetyl-CoA carboxylase biotin carboxyl carrier protein [Lentilactobacillus sp. SPB1-3]|uniref:Acetyl-CoA carboxylase biotin carboxyl carrier protein n=1 Tax=Lentilactobacillus terminaliae TaxID=3003483 RepID=A0ACD5DG73_9LACO|nr:acetyl-CoA carboxylase biotin carboxyl carrier protein [Lentilactobacillus sp. SPB1-3]MCZ0976808.1 acetyl-CoA carboxylase biotin carboxyl carrier protein [Lentilactobacillus sp. SPB1-3]
MDEKSIEKLMEKFDQSSMMNFELQDDDFKLSLSKRESAEPTIIGNAEQVDRSSSSTDIEATESTDDANGSLPTENTEAVEIKAPLVGVVYFSPSPEKPAFKAIGDHVSKGEVVCVIEAMKMINEVKSNVAGVITNTLVEDGSMVEFDQPIFQVEEE